MASSTTAGSGASSILIPETESSPQSPPLQSAVLSPLEQRIAGIFESHDCSLWMSPFNEILLLEAAIRDLAAGATLSWAIVEKGGKTFWKVKGTDEQLGLLLRWASQSNFDHFLPTNVAVEVHKGPSATVKWDGKDVSADRVHDAWSQHLVRLQQVEAEAKLCILSISDAVSADRDDEDAGCDTELPPMRTSLVFDMDRYMRWSVHLRRFRDGHPLPPIDDDALSLKSRRLFDDFAYEWFAQRADFCCWIEVDAELEDEVANAVLSGHGHTRVLERLKLEEAAAMVELKRCLRSRSQYALRRIARCCRVEAVSKFGTVQFNNVRRCNCAVNFSNGRRPAPFDPCDRHTLPPDMTMAGASIEALFGSPDYANRRLPTVEQVAGELPTAEWRIVTSLHVLTTTAEIIMTRDLVVKTALPAEFFIWKNGRSRYENFLERRAAASSLLL